MRTGISKITESNYYNYWKRYHFLQKKEGVNYYKGKPCYLQLKDVRKMIGLHTNADSKTLTKFLKENGISKRQWYKHDKINL